MPLPDLNLDLGQLINLVITLGGIYGAHKATLRADGKREAEREAALSELKEDVTALTQARRQADRDLADLTRQLDVVQALQEQQEKSINAWFARIDATVRDLHVRLDAAFGIGSGRRTGPPT